MALAPKRKKTLARVGLLAAGVLLPLCIAEAALRLTTPPRPPPHPIAVVCGDCPYVYQLNPTRKEVSPQGFVGQKVYQEAKPPGVTRILALGDSVTFGVGISGVDQAFPALLERSLNEKRAGGVEVMNAGVPGYSPYNELHLYKDRARAYSPDVVLVGFCLNDIADPENHWFSTVPRSQRAKARIPPEAILNPAYHQAVTVPRDEARRKAATTHSLPYRLLVQTSLGRLAIGRFTSRGTPPPPTATVAGKVWPVDVTGEDDIGIQVLTDYDSPESRWLHGIYDQLHQAVREGGGTMVVVLFPLEYQLEEGYPFLPQEQLSRYCKERGLLCLDLLPALRKRRDERMFVGKETRPGAPIVRDIWHLSERGHAVVAEEIEAFLAANGLLKPAP